MRGKDFCHFIFGRFHGITPAYAGKRPILYASAKSVRDHPRLCGEKDKKICIGDNDLGSPPPMRGKDCCRAKKR